MSSLAPVHPQEMKALLDDLAERFNRPGFITDDPIAIPHEYRHKEDIEIAGFLTATLAWGQRPVILRSARELLRRMDHSPADYVRQSTPADWEQLNDFVHRTFNGTDAAHFMRVLQDIYRNRGGLEAVMSFGIAEGTPDLRSGLAELHRVFFSIPGSPSRTRKHVPDVQRGSAGKRLMMYLRWMVRKDHKGVDFGLWQTISPAQLLIPLDLHTGRVARALGLLSRRQDDMRAVLELTERLRELDPQDPVRYDFALYGLGVSGWLNKPPKCR